MKNTMDNAGPNRNHTPVVTSVSDPIQHAEDILRAWILQYHVNAIGVEASVRSLELAHNALATLAEAAKGGR